MRSSSRRLILASASPRRHLLLTRLGLPHLILPSAVRETNLGGEVPPKMAIRLAVEKASQVAQQVKEGLVIGCDTIVALDGKPLGKPEDANEAGQMLRRLRGKRHLVVTGLAVVQAASGQLETGLVCTVVKMRRYSDEQIEAYVASGSPMDKAGAYGIQDIPFTPADSIDGCYCNVLGLPALALCQLLLRFGVSRRYEGSDGCGYPDRFAGERCQLKMLDCR